MKIYYLYSKDEHMHLNSAGHDYTTAYIPVLAAYMGITVNAISPDALAALSPDDVLFVGAQRIDELPICRVIMLGSGIGKDVTPQTRTQRIFGRYLLNSYRIPLFAELRAPQLVDAKVIAYVDVDGNTVPALVRRGDVFEFCFDLAGSVWFSSDGFEPDPPPSYFYIQRTPDKRPLSDDDEAHGYAYNDMLVGEIEKILRIFGVSAIYRLMPNEDGSAPDMMMNFSGDDDFCGERIMLSATLAMEKLGLPYHINAMTKPSADFAFGKDTFDLLKSHGCEVALHTNFSGSPYSSETVAVQCKKFEKIFGIHPYTNTNHCFVQGGNNAERLRWFDAAGIKADNSKLGDFNPANINSFDICGFGFGSSFPRFSLDDAEHANRAFSTLEIPINYYEPRLYTEDSSTEKLIGYVDGGADYARIVGFFIHPHYLFEGGGGTESTLRALNVVKEHIEHHNYSVLMTTTNRITEFWHERAKTTLEYGENEVHIDTKIPLLLRLPNCLKSDKVYVDGASAKLERKTLKDEYADLVYIPFGEHRVCW